MDGTFRSRTTTALARRAASLGLAALALSAAPALAADPATDFAAGSAPVQSATDLAKGYWNVAPCGGNVSIVWMPLADTTNATSTWTNPVGQYSAPEQNGSCQVAFNSALTWDWTRFCSILVHEYGHLSGKPHASDEADVMYPYYEKPVDQCVAAAPTQPAVVPEIVQPAAVLPALKPEQAPATDSTSATTRPRAITSARRVKHAILIVVREPKRQGKHRRHRLQPKHRKHRTAKRQTAKRIKPRHHRRTTP